MYKCISVSDGAYTWEKFSTGGGGGDSYYHTIRETLDTAHGDTDTHANAAYIWGLYDALMEVHPGEVQKKEVQNNDGTFTNYVYEISTREYPTDGLYANAYEADPQIKKPKYLILSGIHGDERKTCLSTYKFIRDVLRGHNVPQSFREGVTLCVMPVGNPSGINAFNRPSENAVDINRNFDWHWASGTETNELYGTYTYGADAASEKETQAIVNWLASHTDAELFIDYHNSGQINEQVVIMGLADTQKKIAMRGIDRIIPYWEDVIGYPKTMALSSGEKNVIFSYTATAEIAGAHCYAQEVLGINSLAMETAVFYPVGDLTHAAFLDNRHLCPPETIAMGAEALGNILIEFYAQSCEVMAMNKKLDTLIAQVNSGFHSESGTLVVEADAGSTANPHTVKIPCTNGAKVVVFQADDATYNKITTETAKTDGAYWVIGVFGNCVGKVGSKDNRSFMAYMNVTLYNNKEYWMPYDGATTGNNADGFTFSCYGIKAGAYNWKAYYWNE